MKVLTADALQALIDTIEQYAFTDKGNGHFCKCNGYKVELNINYCPISCECGDYIHRQKKVNGSCKHMCAVSAFYAPSISQLKDDTLNPVVWVSRIGRLVPVRWSQLSQEEARNWYRDHNSDDYEINIYA